MHDPLTGMDLSDVSGKDLAMLKISDARSQATINLAYQNAFYIAELCERIHELENNLARLMEGK